MFGTDTSRQLIIQSRHAIVFSHPKIRFAHVLPWVRQDDFLACPSRWRGFRLFHRHQVTDVGENRLQVRHLVRLCVLCTADLYSDRRTQWNRRIDDVTTTTTTVVGDVDRRQDEDDARGELLLTPLFHRGRQTHASAGRQVRERKNGATATD